MRLKSAILVVIMSFCITISAFAEVDVDKAIKIENIITSNETISFDVVYSRPDEIEWEPYTICFNLSWDANDSEPAKVLKIEALTEGVRIIENGKDELALPGNYRCDVLVYGDRSTHQMPNPATIRVTCERKTEQDTLFLRNVIGGDFDDITDDGIGGVVLDWNFGKALSLSTPKEIKNTEVVSTSTTSIAVDTSNVNEIYEGKTFTVPVKITDNPGFTACILEADYDKDALELTSITNGDMATSLAANDIATGTANITSDSSITKESGTLFNYTFKVKEGASPGDYDITMKYRNEDSGNFCNDDDDVPVTFVKGTVKVVEKPEVIPADSQTTVWLSTDTATVNPDGTFNVDVFMKSDQLLASGQVDLEYNPAVAKIQSITVNSPQGVSNGESNYDNEAGTAKISFYGDNLNASGDAGLKVATIQMNALTAGTSDMKITSADASPKGSDGNSLDQKVTISEEAAEVTVEVVEPSGFRVIPYVNGHRYLVMYEPSVAITEGVPTYLGQDMFWSEQYSFEANGTKGVWVCLTDKDVSLELKESDFGRNAEGTKSTVCYPAAPVQGYLAGDVSGNGKVNIIDAQAAYDLSNRVYSTYDPIDMLHWLMADVNGNSLLEASDAQAIQYYIHYNTFALPAEG